MTIFKYLLESLYENSDSQPPMSEEDAFKKLASYTHYKGSDGTMYPSTRWADWFQGTSRKGKIVIVKDIKKDDELKDALLSIFYYRYIDELNISDMDYDTFLNTPITLYRGINTKHGDYVNYEFDAYTPIKHIADHFAGKNGEVISKTIKPKDTYGAVQYIGHEFEVLVPVDDSDLSDDEYTRKVNDIFDYSTDFGKWWDRMEKYYDYNIGSPKEEWLYVNNKIIPQYNAFNEYQKIITNDIVKKIVSDNKKDEVDSYRNSGDFISLLKLVKQYL